MTAFYSGTDQIVQKLKKKIVDISETFRNTLRFLKMYNNCFGQKNPAGLNIVTIPNALNDWAYDYGLSGCGFESRYCHLNFRYGACFEPKVPGHSGKL